MQYIKSRILGKCPPHEEGDLSARFLDAFDFCKCLSQLRAIHDTKTANHSIETAGRKWKLLHICCTAIEISQPVLKRTPEGTKQRAGSKIGSQHPAIRPGLPCQTDGRIARPRCQVEHRHSRFYSCRLQQFYIETRALFTSCFTQLLASQAAVQPDLTECHTRGYSCTGRFVCHGPIRQSWLSRPWQVAPASKRQPGTLALTASRIHWSSVNRSRCPLNCSWRTRLSSMR